MNREQEGLTQALYTASLAIRRNSLRLNARIPSPLLGRLAQKVDRMTPTHEERHVLLSRIGPFTRHELP
jgi:hypothetical protein